MKYRALEMRLEDLQTQEEMLIKRIEQAKADGEDRSVLGELMLDYARVVARRDEILLWQKMEEDNPKYGTQVRVDGMWRPKLPEFGSIEKALEAMNSPTGSGIHSAAAVKAAREFRAKEDASNTVRSLDGRSPLIPEGERKPFNTTL